MSTVSSLHSSGYYSLSSQLQSDSKEGQATSAAARTSAAKTSTSSALEKALSGSSDSAYQLSLSPTAQAYLAKLNAGESTSTSDSSASSAVTLNTQQLQQVKNVLAKYKDAPFTQDTFNQIQDDLKAAGLAPQQLAIKHQLATFNPTATMLEMLNDPTATPKVQQSADILADVQKSADSYMQNITALWRASSTTATAAQDSKAAVSAS